jgi:hypothetical protein
VQLAQELLHSPLSSSQHSVHKSLSGLLVHVAVSQYLLAGVIGINYVIIQHYCMVICNVQGVAQVLLIYSLS